MGISSEIFGILCYSPSIKAKLLFKFMKQSLKFPILLKLICQETMKYCSSLEENNDITWLGKRSTFSLILYWQPFKINHKRNGRWNNHNGSKYPEKYQTSKQLSCKQKIKCNSMSDLVLNPTNNPLFYLKPK